MSKIDQPSARTFTQKARRAQIVQAAIETVAELGYSNASFIKISKHAGLSSTGMISYHFSGKPELLMEIVTTIFETAENITGSRISQESTYCGKLDAYIRSNLDFVARYPTYTRALTEIASVLGCRQVTGIEGLEMSILSLDQLVDLLEQGRRAEEFGSFDPFTMALAIRGAIDNFLRYHLHEVELDLDRCAEELAEIFYRCTRPA